MCVALLGVSMTSMADTPFGLKLGMTLSEVEKVSGKSDKLNNNSYSFNSVPVPYDGFQRYVMVITPQNGLCEIIGFGKYIPSGSFGEAIKSEFSAIREPLVAKYGKPKNNFDFIRANSIWKNSSDWMVALHREDRVLTTTWEPKEKVGIKKIMLSAKARGRNEGYITLSYELSNSDQCRLEKKGAKDTRGL